MLMDQDRDILIPHQEVNGLIIHPHHLLVDRVRNVIACQLVIVVVNVSLQDHVVTLREIVVLLEPLVQHIDRFFEVL